MPALPEGVSFRAQRPKDLERTEFLTSDEQWFRPVNMVTGPDGMLYVVDMYRDIIEDYSAIPRYLQQQYVRSLIAGADRGRIWRIAYGERKRQESCDLTQMSSDALVDCLHHMNAWWRETAQRLLVQRQDRSVVRQLEAVVERAPTPQARHIALDANGSLEERQTALATMGAAPYEQWASLVGELLDPRYPIELQLAAVRMVSDVRDESVTPLLLEKFSQYSPILRQAVVDALFARRQRLPALLTAMEQGHAIRSMLDTDVGR